MAGTSQGSDVESVRHLGGTLAESPKVTASAGGGLGEGIPAGGSKRESKADLARIELARGLEQQEGDAAQSILRQTSKQKRRRRQSMVKMMQKRVFVDDWTYTFESTVRFTIPLMLFFGWVVYLVIAVSTLLATVQRDNERMVTLQRLAIDCVDYIRLGQDVGFLTPTSNVTRGLRQAAAEEIEGRIIDVLRRVTVGGDFEDESTGLSTSLSTIEDTFPRRILFQEACFGSPEYDACVVAGEDILELQGLVFGFIDPRTRTFTRSMRDGATTAIYSMSQGIRQFIGGRGSPDLFPSANSNYSPFINPIYLQLLLLTSGFAQPHLHDSLRRVA